MNQEGFFWIKYISIKQVTMMGGKDEEILKILISSCISR